MAKTTASPPRTAAAPRGWDLSKVENRGVWRRFLHTCAVARIPYGMLLAYILLNAGQSILLVKIPQVNANFFTGDVSVNSVTLFIGAELLSTVIVQFVHYINQRLRAKTNRNLRNVLWGKILRLKPSYFDRVTPNTLLSRITIDTDSLNSFVLDILLGIVFQVYLLVLTLREMSGVSLRASFMMLVFMPLSLLLSFVMGRLNLKFENTIKFKMAGLTDYLSELMASLPVVKAFNQQDYETQRGRKAVDEYYAADRNRIFLETAGSSAGSIVGMIPDVAVILIGIRFLRNSTLTAEGWYLFYVYSHTLLSFVSSMGSLWQQSKSIQGQLNRVSEVLFETEEGIESYVQEAVESGDIVFDNVTFRYGEILALDKVSFTIPEKKTTALVGYSGSGKSTILKLLERIYDPCEGRILVHGRELKDCGLRAWRDRIAYVSQSAPMISGTIRENVLYGIRRQVSDEEIMEAARLVRAEEFIRSSPEGLDRQVGQFGSKLSGGQRQKIAIARAILAKADYIILDEPTASLDIVSANEVTQAVEALQHKATVIMIAHQPRIIRGADQIIVVSQDHTAVSGSHQELLETNEFYARLTRGEEAEA